MRAIVWTGETLGVVEGVALRPPDDDEVVVEIAAAGLCHSDLNPIHGSYRQPVPAVLGHEAVGTVVDAGADAAALVGATVVLSPLEGCGTCRHCAAGTPSTCLTPPSRRATPFRLDGGVVHQFVGLGAWAERTVVGANQVIPVPDGIPAPSAALLGCAVVTGTGAVRRAGVVPGDVVLVTGAGGIGLNAVQAARWSGAARVLVADRNPAKEAIARRVGATDFLHVADAGDLREQVRALAPRGVDAAIECVGRVDVLETAIAALGVGGRAVIVGLPGARDAMTVPVRSLFADKAVLGCRMGSVDPHTAIPELARRYLDGELELDALVSTVVPAEEITTLVDDLEHGRLDRGVLRF